LLVFRNAVTLLFTSWLLVFPHCRTVLSCIRNPLCLRGCIQKFLDWPPGARTTNGTALCRWVQLYRYFVSQSSEFCRHNPLCCFSTCLLFISLSTQSENFWMHPPMFGKRTLPSQ
jgi:hypothetical protein